MALIFPLIQSTEASLISYFKNLGVIEDRKWQMKVNSLLQKLWDRLSVQPNLAYARREKS